MDTYVPGRPRAERSSYFQFPIFARHQRGYCINRDCYITGWWTLRIGFALDRYQQARGIGFRVHIGWAGPNA